MALTRLSPAETRLDLGDEWLIAVMVTSDTTGDPIAATTTLTATDPASADEVTSVEALATGVYQAAVTVDVAGRWIAAVAVAGHGVATFAALVEATVEALPTLEQVTTYLGETSATSADITDALAAETAAQAAACRVPATYPADLAQALKRRVARNLAARSVPLAVLSSFEQGGAVRLSAIDAEVRRFEAPWRRHPIG